MAAVALVVAFLALAIASLGVLVVLTWRSDVGRIRDLAERLDVETRLEYLTTQTLGGGDRRPGSSVALTPREPAARVHAEPEQCERLAASPSR